MGSPLRRAPVQRRSAERVEQILDVTAALLDEVGYESITTTAIARRAGVSVGTLYQFFPDKRAVVQELTRRNMAGFVDEAGRNVAGLSNWWDVVDSVIDVYIRMHREVPGFAQVHFGDPIDRTFLDEEEDNNTVVVEALTRTFAEHVDVPVEDLRFCLTVANECADALLKLAFRRNPAGDDRLIAETKFVVHGYLRNRFAGS